MTSAVLPATIRADRLREVLRMFDDDFESIDDKARVRGASTTMEAEEAALLPTALPAALRKPDWIAKERPSKQS